MTTLRAHFDGKVFVPEGPVNLPSGKTFEVDVRELGESSANGSANALLQAMDIGPAVNPEDVNELERQIKLGRVNVNSEGAFDRDK